MTSTGDGRNIDPSSGILEGEASEQAVPADRATSEGGAPYDVWRGAGTGPAPPTYYDRPVLKEPVWIWAVPAYFYAGGTAGGAAVLGAAAQLVDRHELDGLIRRSRWIAAAGTAAGTALLIVDLGKPGRFLNMLRVFRATSPLSVGSWILAPATVLAAASAALPGAAGDAAGLAAGALGAPLSGYTAVLLNNTAIPVWQAPRRALPPLFVASAAAGAASLLDLLDLSDREHRLVWHFGVAAKAADLLAATAVEKEASAVDRVGRALKEGLGGALWRTAKLCTAASLAASLVPVGSRRVRRRVSGALGTAGAIALRFALWHAGKTSSADPRATFEMQRAGHGAADVTGIPAVTGPGGRRALS
ncbi:MAG: NrfD/PsrC family molybdoenzyme membrane anchor subunit [Actinomycetota bacterium]